MHNVSEKNANLLLNELKDAPPEQVGIDLVYGMRHQGGTHFNFLFLIFATGTSSFLYFFPSFFYRSTKLSVIFQQVLANWNFT